MTIIMAMITLFINLHEISVYTDNTDNGFCLFQKITPKNPAIRLQKKHFEF